MASPPSSQPRPVSSKGDSARPRPDSAPDSAKGPVFKDWASI
ncbi:hypothetical protein [Rhodovulum viride]|nr:hypothetical protein [Rhodovulum viride]